MKLNKHQLQLFEDLTQLNGVAGQENEVAKYLKAAYLSLGCEILTDNLGSIIALKNLKILMLNVYLLLDIWMKVDLWFYKY